MDPISYPYPDSALRFIRERLADGLTLASTVLQGMPPSGGTAALCAGSDAHHLARQELTLHDWRTGGISHVGGQTDCLIGTILKFLEQDSRRLCIIENAVARPDDKWVERRQSHVISYRHELYHLLGSGSSTREIEQGIREAQSAWMLVGFFVGIPEEQDYPDGGEVSEDTIRMWASHCSVCFADAFDGEGYLLWGRFL